MKIGSFKAGDGQYIGIVDEDSKSVRRIEAKGITTIPDLMGLRQTEVASLASNESHSFDDLKFLPPLIPSRNIFCVGKNYREHAREFNQSGFDATSAGKDANVDEFPAFFSKPPSTLVGHYNTIDSHTRIVSELDYEAELAVVIGKEGTAIPRARAFEYVWGYSILNDVTARDLQKAHRQWFFGKSLDTFGPMGPWITTADEVDPENLELECYVNGELRQKANTSGMIFNISTLIEILSSGIRLMPGDIIATGTPAGVGIGLDPPQFLRTGDKIEITISGLGRLCNIVD